MGGGASTAFQGLAEEFQKARSKLTDEQALDLERRFKDPEVQAKGPEFMAEELRKAIAAAQAEGTEAVDPSPDAPPEAATEEASDPTSGGGSGSSSASADEVPVVVRVLTSLPPSESIVREWRSCDSRLPLLIERMNAELPRALGELEGQGRKTSHWAWWAFPTEKEGFSEPTPQTAVTKASAVMLLEHAPPVWRLVLEKTCELITKNDGSIGEVLPSIDHGRVKFFAKFWKTVQGPKGSEWMKEVAKQLGAATR